MCVLCVKTRHETFITAGPQNSEHPLPCEGTASPNALFGAYLASGSVYCKSK